MNKGAFMLKKILRPILNIHRFLRKNFFPNQRLLHEVTSEMKDVQLEGKDLTSIANLEQFTNIEHLNLKRNHIQDVFPLKSLFQLKSLELSHHKKVRVETLPELPNLQVLFLE